MRARARARARARGEGEGEGRGLALPVAYLVRGESTRHAQAREDDGDRQAGRAGVLGDEPPASIRVIHHVTGLQLTDELLECRVCAGQRSGRGLLWCSHDTFVGLVVLRRPRAGSIVHRSGLRRCLHANTAPLTLQLLGHEENRNRAPCMARQAE